MLGKFAIREAGWDFKAMRWKLGTSTPQACQQEIYCFMSNEAVIVIFVKSNYIYGAAGDYQCLFFPTLSDHE